jgi:hypothetical protein
MGSFKRVAALLLANALLIVVVSVIGAAQASAAAPWWRLSSGARPTYLQQGKEGEIFATAENVGEASFEGGNPAKIVDTLPAGLKATAVAGHLPFGNVTESIPCSLESESRVSCSVTRKLLPFAEVEIRIAVTVEGAKTGEMNEVSASGGGGPSASSRLPITVSAGPTPFGVEDYELTNENQGGSPDTQAGSHPFQQTTTIDLNQATPEQPQLAYGPQSEPAGIVKDLNFLWPPGLIGNPTVMPRCTIKQFLTNVNGIENECQPQTAVGVAVVTLYEPHLFGTLVFPVPLFNLEPAVGEPARFGFNVVFANAPVYIDSAIRTGGDYGVTVSTKNITQTVGFISAKVTVWGVPGEASHDNSRGWGCLYGPAPREVEIAPCTNLEAHAPPPFLSMPTACTGQLHSSVESDVWTDEGAYQSVAAQPMQALDGCNRLPFDPSIKVTPDGRAGSTPTGLTVDEHVSQLSTLAPKGLAESDVKGLSVTLPEGVVLNPAGADGLQACSQEQVGLEDAGPVACPEASKIATAKITTPLLPNALEGAAYLAAQDKNPFGSLVAMYIYAEDPVSGVRIKAAGEVLENPVTGQLTAHFEHDPAYSNLGTDAQFLPQAPFEDVELHFFGGDRAPLGTPALCGSYTTVGTFSPWSGNPTSESSSTFDVNSGPNGTPCANPLPFTPTLTAGTTSIQAGGFSPFTMTMSREDGQQSLRSVKLKMPPGLSGTLATVKLCEEAQANAGTCGEESLIGETTVSVGLGGDPYSVKGGKVYITGPYKGAPFGLSIVNPAKAGPFDLGEVVVRAKVEVDPITAVLTVTTDDSGPYKIPTILDGIPLQIKHVNVLINRPGFTFNPTNCEPLKIAGSLTSSGGSTASLSVPFQATNCAVLAFKPKLAVSTSGKTSRKNGASLAVKLTYPAGPYDANIAKVKVDLPKQLPSRLTTLQKACPAATFEANPGACPAGSIVGVANATTPVLPVALKGPAYFVSYGGAKFPELVIVLQGYGVTVYLHGETFISKAGITSSTFRTIPDVPVGTFELVLPGGPGSALAANGDLCRAKLGMPTSFSGQNGARINTTTPIRVTGCARHRVVKKRAVKAGKRHNAVTYGKR